MGIFEDLPVRSNADKEKVEASWWNIIRTKLISAFPAIGESGSFLALPNQNELRFYETEDNGTNYISIKAPATLAGDVNYTLPNADGSSGNFLSTNGSGGLAWASSSGLINYSEKVATYSVTSSDDIVSGDATSGTFDFSLPTAVGIAGKVIILKKSIADLTFNPITVVPDGSETIDGAASTTLDSAGESIKIISDGANWKIIERIIPSFWMPWTVTFNWSANASADGQMKRVGDSLIFSLRVANTGAQSNALVVTLPATIDTTKITNLTSAANLGTSFYHDNTATAANCSGHATYNSPTTVFFIRDGGTTVNQASPFTWANGDWASWASIPIPISGWNS